MTKEGLISALKSDESWDEIEFTFNEFFSQNVVIPRGENRHPYADVLHAYAEGIECQIVLRDNTVQTIEGIDFFSFGTRQKNVRIKPSEPVIEIQYAVINFKGIAKLEWMTIAEALSKYGNNAYPIEETKRVRNV